MPDPILQPLLPPIINQRLNGLLASGEAVRTSKIVVLEESRVVRPCLRLFCHNRQRHPIQRDRPASVGLEGLAGGLS
jgi:hypothetical protein